METATLVTFIAYLLVSVVALVLALNPKDSILDIVAYAWAGLGAAFGPVVLFALFSKRTTWLSALLGMVVGTVVLILWHRVGLDAKLYEIVPGFCANCVTIPLLDPIR
ncbi:MAG: sodium:proline symporter, partial [Planctomycetes bacterium]|nr:sodium:proline symporter [Planctomycetota bacterium]